MESVETDGLCVGFVLLENEYPQSCSKSQLVLNTTLFQPNRDSGPAYIGSDLTKHNHMSYFDSHKKSHCLHQELKLLQGVSQVY